jgi:hypothetical protein
MAQAAHTKHDLSELDRYHLCNIREWKEKRYLRRVCAWNLCHVLADLEKTTPSHGGSHLALS